MVSKLIKEKNFDLGFSFFMRTAEYLKNVEMPKILMAEDCRTVYQQRSYEGSSNLKQKIVRLWEWKKLKKYEPEIVNHFDVTTLVSNDDIRHMTKLNSNVNYRLLTNGVDIEKFTPDIKTERNNLLFTGKFDVWANELMVSRIVNEILPLVKKRFPNVKLTLAGANPTKAIQNLKSDDIEIYSNVPEIVPYLQNAAVYVHPHYGGSGIQNKLLEAMCAECPVVTTSTGNQGIEANDGKEILISDTSEGIAEKVISLLSDKQLADTISNNAHEYIVRKHSWEAIYNQCDEIIAEVCQINE
jgi:glycosyltransferase involved in cell wall biosynthesis